MLYIISTPIGNLGDMSLRAIETLKQVDYVVSEDTRKTGFLLKHFDIKKPQISFHAFNEKKTLPHLVELLKQGKDIGLVCNAGTPAISDPGFSLVRAAIENAFPLTAVPGPTALVMALVLSGLPAHSFTFRGFPPRKSAARRRFLEIDKDSPHTLIFYESPYRLLEFFDDAIAVYGDRKAALANDLTKKFEKVWRGSLIEIRQQLSEEKLLGEYTIVIAGADS